ncbi:hypothetical protein DPX16_0239 [Anabarilius grahami]|uniref:Uncharacterized protein n=1 Tax=Anabarilius grahami TaxID=495550 RepID=A0A3N0Z6S4_ANAGA|nr:hypothetical protein DPX16_0239 [Anabarilius grahami]
MSWPHDVKSLPRDHMIWISVNTLELGDRWRWVEHSHTGDKAHRGKETRHTEERRHAGDSAVDECNDEVQVAVISTLGMECAMIGGCWNLTCL